MFSLMNNITLVLRLPLLWLLTSVLGVHYLISNMISLGIITVVRFWASDEYIWGEHGEHASPAPRQARGGCRKHS